MVALSALSAFPYALSEEEARYELERTERKQQAALIAAFTHPNRLHILQILRDGQGGLDVQQLEERLNLQGCEINQSVISHHLSKLHAAGVVGFHKQGLHVYYFIHQSALTQTMSIFAGLHPREEEK